VYSCICFGGALLPTGLTNSKSWCLLLRVFFSNCTMIFSVKYRVDTSLHHEILTAVHINIYTAALGVSIITPYLSCFTGRQTQTWLGCRHYSHSKVSVGVSVRWLCVIHTDDTHVHMDTQIQSTYTRVNSTLFRGPDDPDSIYETYRVDPLDKTANAAFDEGARKFDHFSGDMTCVSGCIQKNVSPDENQNYDEIRSNGANVL